MVKFTELNHCYESIIPDDVKWLGVTTLVGHLHPAFDRTPYDCSLRKPTIGKPNKWYKLPAEEIQAAWTAEASRSTILGSWYHNKREQSLYNNGDHKVFRPIINGDVKLAPDQKLVEGGIYPEHLVYLASAGICGQSDYVEVKEGKINIRDYKTSKKIDRTAYKNWEGVVKKMLAPVGHLEDCHFYHYALQLSIYMYIMLRHNPQLLPGTLIIEHIKFQIESEDKYGYPIYAKDDNGDYIVTEIEEISLPYLAKEVKAIVEWLKTNKSKLVKHTH